MYFKKGVENIEGKNKNIYNTEGSRKKYIKFKNQYISIRTYKQNLKKKRGQKGGGNDNDLFYRIIRINAGIMDATSNEEFLEDITKKSTNNRDIFLKTHYNNDFHIPNINTLVEISESFNYIVDKLEKILQSKEKKESYVYVDAILSDARRAVEIINELIKKRRGQKDGDEVINFICTKTG